MGHLGHLKTEYQSLISRLDAGLVGLPEPEDEEAKLGRRRILEILCTRYTLSNERLTVATGVISKRIDEIELYRVKDTRLEIPLHLRLFGRAHIVLLTSDKSHCELRLRAISDAEMLRNQIRGLVEKRRDAKGVRELDV